MSTADVRAFKTLKGPLTALRASLMGVGYFIDP